MRGVPWNCYSTKVPRNCANDYTRLYDLREIPQIICWVSLSGVALRAMPRQALTPTLYLTPRMY